MNVRLDRQNPYLRIDAVNVYVRDQDRSLEFYLNQLGFHLALDIGLQSGHRLVAFKPKGPIIVDHRQGAKEVQQGIGINRCDVIGRC